LDEHGAIVLLEEDALPMIAAKRDVVDAPFHVVRGSGRGFLVRSSRSSKANVERAAT
jgi:hypothetical protein